MKLLSALAACAVMFAHASADEMETAELGPPVGATIPHSLEATDFTGADQSFESLVGENGLALFFIRSLDWCPYCQLQTLELAKESAAFNALGLNMTFVSYDTPEEQMMFTKKWDINPTILSDTESEIIKAFDLLDANYEPDSYGYGVPYPIGFILDTDGKVLAKLHQDDYLTNDKSYRGRPAVEAFLEAAETVLSE